MIDEREGMMPRQLPLELSQLERLAAGAPTFLPLWPAPEGTGWVAYVPEDDRKAACFVADDRDLFDDLVETFQAAVWFALPQAELG